MNYMEQVAHMLGVELDEEFCIKGNDNKFKITKYGMCVFSEFSAVWDFANDILVGILTEHYEIKKPILTDKEKEYLSGIIKPFRNRVKYITKFRGVFDNEFIEIGHVMDNEAELYYIELPLFKKGTMYKGMEVGEEYSLEDLGV